LRELTQKPALVIGSLRPRQLRTLALRRRRRDRRCVRHRRCWRARRGRWVFHSALRL